MRKAIWAAILASSVLTAPAAARDGAWYIELDGGLVFPDDLEGAVSGGPLAGATPSDAYVVSDTGYDFGGIVGRDFGAFRLEAEGSYRRASARNISVPDLGVSTFPIDGRASVLSGMANALLELSDESGHSIYAGGGGGYAKVKLDY